MKTKRSNVPEKRAHWKAARTERRGRFAHADFEVVDQDLAYRASDRTVARGGRTIVHFNGHNTRVLWNTADKSRIKWKATMGQLSDRDLDRLRKSLHLRF